MQGTTGTSKKLKLVACKLFDAQAWSQQAQTTQKPLTRQRARKNKRQQINHNAHCEQTTRNVDKIGDAETASLSMNFRPEFPSIAKAQIHRPSNAEAQINRIPHHPEPIESFYWIHDYSGNIESSGSVVANQRPNQRRWGGTKDTHTNAPTQSNSHE